MGPEEEYPWPEKFPPGEITHGALKYLNRFKPLPNPQKPLMLPFERPIADLEAKIDEVWLPTHFLLKTLILLYL